MIRSQGRWPLSPGMTVFALVALLCWLGVAWRLGQLGTADGAMARAPTEDAALFERALAAGLLRAEPDGALRLQIVDTHQLSPHQLSPYLYGPV